MFHLAKLKWSLSEFGQTGNPRSIVLHFTIISTYQLNCDLYECLLSSVCPKKRLCSWHHLRFSFISKPGHRELFHQSLEVSVFSRALPKALKPKCSAGARLANIQLLVPVQLLPISFV
ncbi:hypothetical protein XELAEV_18043147mg [Xenopus laevis]|uniref:Uncharacterized protein n=1 Tax=Xenopus laevis TaxID=8355 RepID=A0A974BWE7_XENLA|nr:hypothetical protein XELAEV_18043147mg [Xenopus laevis]